MEIGTIGSTTPSIASRSIADSGVVSQTVLNQTPEQTTVQTARAVTQVGEMEDIQVARQSTSEKNINEPKRPENTPSTTVNLMTLKVQEKAQQTNGPMNLMAQKAEDAPEQVSLMVQNEPVVQNERATQKESTVQQEKDNPNKASLADLTEKEKERLEKVAENISESFAAKATNLNLSVDDDLGRVVVKVVDQETQEVLKQIPSEEALELSKSIGKMRGMFVQTQA